MKRLFITRMPPLDYAANEALNTLTTNLSFTGSDVRTIMMTSCQPQEGKSFLSMQLMRTMADMGRQVVLIDADLRKSAIVARYGIQSEDERMLGLSHYLAGMCPLEDVVYETDIPGAYMVPVGKDVINSLTLLNTDRLSRMIKSLERSFDTVLVDAPPVGILIDAAEIAKYCDGVVFVVSNNTVTRRELAEATRQIEKSGCPILGAVLNKVTFDTHSAKKYYHKTYYSHYVNEEYYATPQQKPRRTKTQQPSKAPEKAATKKP